MKKLLKYLPFHFLLALILGIYIQFNFKLWQFGFLYIIIFLLILLTLLLGFHQYKKRELFTLTTLFLFIFIGISSVFIQNTKNYKSYYEHFITKNTTAFLTITKILKSGNYYDKYEATVNQINTQKTIGKVLLNIQKDSLQKSLKVDEQFFLKPVFKEIIPPLNPYQFNYKEYLEKQGIYYQVFVNNLQLKIVNNHRFSFVGASAKFRNRIQAKLKEYHFNNNEYAVINALLLGQRQDISKTLLQEYSKAGAIHILAVSGLHVGIILLLLSRLFYPIERFKNGVILKTILIVFLLWIFAFIAGLSASVVRAVSMFTFVAIGQSFQRKKVVEYSLIASMFLLLLIKPMFLFDVGFQLSYLAVFGIIWVQPLLYNLWKSKNYFINKGWQLITVSIAAQAGILPISLYYFHQFPGLFILSNIVIIPFLGTILVGGIAIIILALLGILPQPLADLYGFVIHLMNRFVGFVSQQEDFLFTEISMSIWQMFIWYLVIIFGVQFFIRRKPKQFITFLIAVLLVQGIFFFEEYKSSKKQEFIVFHKSRKTVLGVRKNKELHVFHNLDSVKINQEKSLTSCKTGENITVKYFTEIPNIFQFKNKQILVVDSLGIYKISNLKNPIILLQHSPKINLQRLIETLNPKKIIADGSNYKSYINRWKKTCEQEKTPFYYTGENGAFIISN